MTEDNQTENETVELSREEGMNEVLKVINAIPDTLLEKVLEQKGFHRAPFLDFLQTDRGSKAFDRILIVFESLQKMIVERNHKSALWIRLIQFCGVVVVAVCLLSHFNKFDASVGVLLGTLMGYLFGKDK